MLPCSWCGRLGQRLLNGSSGRSWQDGQLLGEMGRACKTLQKDCKMRQEKGTRQCRGNDGVWREGVRPGGGYFFMKI